MIDFETQLNDYDIRCSLYKNNKEQIKAVSYDEVLDKLQKEGYNDPYENKGSFYYTDFDYVWDYKTESPYENDVIREIPENVIKNICWELIK